MYIYWKIKHSQQENIEPLFASYAIKLANWRCLKHNLSTEGDKTPGSNCQ